MFSSLHHFDLHLEDSIVHPSASALSRLYHYRVALLQLSFHGHSLVREKRAMRAAALRKGSPSRLGKPGEE
jgi:hypothetical protein